MTTVRVDSSGRGSLPTLQRESLRDRTVGAIRDAITLGQLKPGTHLVETQLSEDLGISRGTLREALRSLQQAGLVVETPNGRLSVLSLTEELISDYYEARTCIESAGASLLIKRPDFEAWLTLLQQRLDILAEAEQGSLLENIDADLTFHRTICEGSGNEILLRKWEEVAAVTQMTILNAGQDGAKRNMAASRHQQIVDAIASRDVTQIFNVLHAHTMKAVEVILGDGLVRERTA